MHYLPQSFAVEVRIGIGEHDKGRFYEMYTAVQGGCLALALGVVEDSGLWPVGEAFVGMVVAAVGHPEDA